MLDGYRKRSYVNTRKSVGGSGKIRIRFPGPMHTGERFPKIAGRRTCFMGAGFSYTTFRLRVRARKWSGRGSRRRKWFDLVQQRGRDATTWDTSSLSTSAGVKERRKETGETGVLYFPWYIPRSTCLASDRRTPGRERNCCSTLRHVQPEFFRVTCNRVCCDDGDSRLTEHGNIGEILSTRSCLRACSFWPRAFSREINPCPFSSPANLLILSRSPSENERRQRVAAVSGAFTKNMLAFKAISRCNAWEPWARILSLDNARLRLVSPADVIIFNW